jgi:hypothetical protein
VVGERDLTRQFVGALARDSSQRPTGQRGDVPTERFVRIGRIELGSLDEIRLDSLKLPGQAKSDDMLVCAVG